SGRASTVALYLADEGELAFELFGHRGIQPPRFLSLTQQPSLLQELRRERRPILLEALTQRYAELPSLLTGGDATVKRELERTAEAITSMRILSANAVFPMLVEERVVGLLVLGTDQVTAPYSTEELASLIAIAEACAVLIEGSQEYEKRRQRDRLVAIGEMAAGMAHEIRNPLGAIKGAAQCLDPAELPRDAIEFVDVIIEEVDRLNNVVAQFLEYAKPYRGNPVATDVNKIVAATVRLLGRDAVPVHVTLQQDLAHDLPDVLLDPEQLKQVLINLVQNAVQAMPQGGQVFLSTGASSSPAQHSGNADRDDGVQRAVYVRVRETGPGINETDIARIFVPFFTTKPSGTGLGLAISQRIIENAGGRIEVTSRVGEGTSFTVRVPVMGALSVNEPPHDGHQDQSHDDRRSPERIAS
ncbi:MAG: histidine kinase, partial [Clostridia bacterium]|nr:histidine kinase [Deltaproteobacteria bacterium]